MLAGGFSLGLPPSYVLAPYALLRVIGSDWMLNSCIRKPRADRLTSAKFLSFSQHACILKQSDVETIILFTRHSFERFVWMSAWAIPIYKRLDQI